AAPTCTAGRPRTPRGFVDRRARLERLPPRTMRLVPIDRLSQALVEQDRRRPAELAPDLRGVEKVATIVTGTVGNDRLQRRGPIGQFQDTVRDLLDRLFVARTDVVRFTDAAVHQ